MERKARAMAGGKGVAIDKLVEKELRMFGEIFDLSPNIGKCLGIFLDFWHPENYNHHNSKDGKNPIHVPKVFRDLMVSFFEDKNQQLTKKDMVKLFLSRLGYTFEDIEEEAYLIEVINGIHERRKALGFRVRSEGSFSEIPTHFHGKFLLTAEKNIETWTLEIFCRRNTGYLKDNLSGIKISKIATEEDTDPITISKRKETIELEQKFKTCIGGRPYESEEVELESAIKENGFVMAGESKNDRLNFRLQVPGLSTRRDREHIINSSRNWMNTTRIPETVLFLVSTEFSNLPGEWKLNKGEWRKMSRLIVKGMAAIK